MGWDAADEFVGEYLRLLDLQLEELGPPPERDVNSPLGCVSKPGS
jgi:hypothetical protein